MASLSERRTLITGGAGFLGYHLALELSREAENHLVLVDNLFRGRRDQDLQSLVARSNVELIEGDLTEAATFGRLGSNYDEVYHFAGIIGVDNVLNRPHEVLRVNAVSTLRLMDWFTKGGGKKLMFASTSEAYAWTRQIVALAVPTPEDVPLALTELRNPRSSYAGSKIFGELIVNQFCATHNKPFVIVRYHNIYGPRMGNDHAIPQIYARALQGQNPLIVYSAGHTRAFCYVTDAVRATIDGMREAAANGETINIGNDLEEITIGELAQLLLRKAKISATLEPRMATNDPIQRRCPDLTRARQLLGYRPQVTLDEGLELTLTWYAGNSSRTMVERVNLQ